MVVVVVVVVVVVATLSCNDPKQGHLLMITSQNPICMTPHCDGEY